MIYTHKRHCLWTVLALKPAILMVKSVHINNVNWHYHIKHCIAEIPYQTTKPRTSVWSGRGIPMHHPTRRCVSLSWRLFLKAHNIHSLPWGPSHLLVIDSRLAVTSKISFDILCSDGGCQLCSLDFGNVKVYCL